MTNLSSLTQSIFGTAKEEGDNNDSNDAKISGLFDSKSLPKTPNFTNNTNSTSSRRKRQRNEETTALETKKQKNNNDNEHMTVFVGNLPMNMTRRRLASMFKSCGNVSSSRLRSVPITNLVKVSSEHARNQNLIKKVSINTAKHNTKDDDDDDDSNDTKNLTQSGYVVFDTMDAVEKAVLMNNTKIPDSDLVVRVDYAKATMDSARSVFVGNLPFEETDESSLRKHFDLPNEAIEGVRIVRDATTHQCKGFGYLLFKDKSYVPQALAMHESQYKNRTIRVFVCGKQFKSNKSNKPTKPKSNTKSNTKPNTTKTKKRGIKKSKKHSTTTNNATNTLSKRATATKKKEKRIKKVQKRLTKGMGKTKKNAT